jgi:hypothetical protein
MLSVNEPTDEPIVEHSRVRPRPEEEAESDLETLQPRSRARIE